MGGGGDHTGGGRGVGVGGGGRPVSRRGVHKAGENSGASGAVDEDALVIEFAQAAYGFDAGEESGVVVDEFEIAIVDCMGVAVVAGGDGELPGFEGAGAIACECVIAGEVVELA